jgi:flagellar biosynthetic protein FliQ
MTAETVMSLIFQAMKIAMVVAGPLLLIALVVGLVVSVFQAATQINEMTLTFIPKVLAICGGLVLFGPWMMGQMTDYIRQLISQIPSLIS